MTPELNEIDELLQGPTMWKKVCNIERRSFSIDMKSGFSFLTRDTLYWLLGAKAA
jgi:hypothetical protein